MCYTSIDVKHNNGSLVGYDGTSCASPFVAYSIGLMISHLRKNNKRVPTREEIRTLLWLYAKDIEEVGFDTASGYGIIRLPSPEELLNIVKGESENMKFIDVNESDWFYDSVKFVVDKGLMKGKSESKFDPNAGMTRAEFATGIKNLIEYLERRQ